MGGWLAGAKAKSATDSFLHYYPEKIQLENWLQLGNGKVCRVMWAYHDRTKGIFCARLSINDGQFKYVEARTQEDLERKVAEIFEAI